MSKDTLSFNARLGEWRWHRRQSKAKDPAQILSNVIHDDGGSSTSNVWLRRFDKNGFRSDLICTRTLTHWAWCLETFRCAYPSCRYDWHFEVVGDIACTSLQDQAVTFRSLLIGISLADMREHNFVVGDNLCLQPDNSHTYLKTTASQSHITLSVICAESCYSDVVVKVSRTVVWTSFQMLIRGAF